MANYPPQAHQARKRFGQNFLVDAAVVESIVRAIDPQQQDNMVEIGPGLSALTAPLVERLERWSVIEIDRDLAQRLRERFPVERLNIVEGDALQLDFAHFADRLRIVANLPYNISVPVLLHFLETFESLRFGLVLVQAEVAHRLAATPGRSCSSLLEPAVPAKAH